MMTGRVIQIKRDFVRGMFEAKVLVPAAEKEALRWIGEGLLWECEDVDHCETRYDAALGMSTVTVWWHPRRILKARGGGHWGVWWLEGEMDGLTVHAWCLMMQFFDVAGVYPTQMMLCPEMAMGMGQFEARGYGQSKVMLNVVGSGLIGRDMMVVL